MRRISSWKKKLGKIEVASIYLSIALGLLGCSMSRFLQQGCALLYQSIKLMGYSLICKLWSNQSNLQLGSNMMSLDLIELDGRFFRQNKKSWNLTIVWSSQIQTQIVMESSITSNIEE